MQVYNNSKTIKINRPRSIRIDVTRKILALSLELECGREPSKILWRMYTVQVAIK